MQIYKLNVIQRAKHAATALPVKSEPHRILRTLIKHTGHFLAMLLAGKYRCCRFSPELSYDRNISLPPLKPARSTMGSTPRTTWPEKLE